MRSQTGLDHTVLVDDVVAATTLGSHPSLPRSSVSEHGQPGPKYAFAWAGEPYYAERLILQASSDDGAPSIQAEVALAVAGVESTAQRLMRMLLGSIALASIVGFVLAVFLAHRISRPLGELANAANAMSRGDLAVSFTADGTVREVALVGKALNDARADLQFTVNELRREKAWTDHFLANVSHEFRTPLSAVAAAVELLMDQAPDLSPAESQELLTSLHLGVVNLQNFVDNLLESASIEAGRFQVHPRPCTLNDSIAEAVRIMQPLLSKHGQRLIVELPASLPMAKADPRRTVQVLVNLLSNANKYGPADAEIALSVSTSDGWIRLSVGDRGPGIPAGQRGDLFQRFATSTDGGDQRQVGFGLGLSVVKAIVEGHNGEVGVDDRPGGGAAFWFTLPVADEL
jgi:signal transduction histidine kinase